MVVVAVALIAGYKANANQGLVVYSSNGTLHASWVADPNICLYLSKPTGTLVLIDTSCGKAEAIVPPRPDMSYLYQPNVGDTLLLRDDRTYTVVDSVLIDQLPSMTATPLPVPTNLPSPTPIAYWYQMIFPLFVTPP